MHSSNTLLVLRRAITMSFVLLLLSPLLLCKEGVDRSSRWTTVPVLLIRGNVQLCHLPILWCGNPLFYKQQQTPRCLLESFLNECFSIHFAHHCPINLSQILLFHFRFRTFTDILLPIELKPQHHGGLGWLSQLSTSQWLRS